MLGLRRGLAVASLGLASILYAGDGSDVPGFVPPPKDSKQLPPPPANMSGGETFVPFPPPPATPASRSEKKNPPRPPTIFTWAIGNEKDALATPRTLESLLAVMKRDADANYASEVKSLDEVSPDPDKNPIIYCATHFNVDLTQKQRGTLREFMLRGGTLILNPGRGSKPAYDSAIKELSLILPQGSIQRLSPDNPLFHSYYDVDKMVVLSGKDGRKTIAPDVTGLIIDCRVAAIVPRYGLDSCAEDVREGIDFVPIPEYAQKLGINILSYASAMRAWQQNVKNKIVLEDKVRAKSGCLSLAQVIYDGEWKTRHAGLPMLLNQFNQVSGVPVKYNYEEVKLSDKKLFDIPVVFMTGHEQFSLNSDERKNLKDYLVGGGVLIAEACCGRRGFDESFRREINSLIPDNMLTSASSRSSLFTMPNLLGQMDVTPALANQLKCSKTDLQIYTLTINGRDAVIYSPIGLQGGWELSPSPYALGYSASDSYKVGENILLNVMTK